MTSSKSSKRAMTSSNSSNRGSDDFFKIQQGSDDLFKIQQESDDFFKIQQERAVRVSGGYEERARARARVQWRRHHRVYTRQQEHG